MAEVAISIHVTGESEDVSTLVCAIQALLIDSGIPLDTHRISVDNIDEWINQQPVRLLPTSEANLDVDAQWYGVGVRSDKLHSDENVISIDTGKQAPTI